MLPIRRYKSYRYLSLAITCSIFLWVIYIFVLSLTDNRCFVDGVEIDSLELCHKIKINHEYDGGPVPPIYNYTIPNAGLCSSARHLVYIVYIYTAPGHFTLREKIRKSWGRKDLFRRFQGRIGFFLGLPRNESVQAAILNENDIHGDIIQTNFIDSYKNLTLKGVMAVKWLSTYCLNARYYIKADDDVLINIFALIRVLYRHVTPARRSFFCWVWPRNPAIRQGNWKWIVNTKQFSSSYYPPYCNGPAWIVTKDIIPELSNATSHVNFMPIEDVFSSGLLPQAIGGVSHIHEVAGIMTEPHGTPLLWYTNGTLSRPLFSVPKEHEYPAAWTMILAGLRERELRELSPSYLKVIL